MVVCVSRSKLMQYNKSHVQYTNEKAESQSDEENCHRCRLMSVSDDIEIIKR
jgi:hypothetical protein